MYSGYKLEERVRNPLLKELIEAIMDVTAGHDHDGENSKLATVGTVADGSVTLAKLAAAVQASLALADSSLQPGEIELAEGTPTNAAAATGTLTLSGVVIDGETVSVGADVYEFCADAAQSLTAGSTIAVDITASVTASQGTLTVDTHPALGDTFTIGDKVFTIVPTDSANGDGDVARGADLAACQAAIVAAINGTDGYNTASEYVTAAAFETDACVLTALVGGTAGDSIDTTETFTAGTNVFDAATLGTTAAGADCSAANAVTALVAAVTASDTQGVGAADGAGDTVVFTADTAGTAGNATTTTEDMANGEFGAATLEGGAAGTVGAQYQTYVDANYLYVCVAANTVTGTNWRRIALGSAY
jgi:hypothetical protein